MEIKSKLSLILKFFVLIAASIGVGWYLLNGVGIANLKPVMKARQFYYFKLPSSLHLKTSRLPFSLLPVQTVKVRQAETNLYVYAFFGKFEKIDADKGILYLKDKNGLVYGFKYFISSPSRLEYYQTVDDRQVLNSLNLVPVDSFSREESFNAGDILLIYWADERTLGEIMDFAQNDPEKLLNIETGINHYQQIILTNK